MEVDDGPVANHEGIKQYYSSKIESLQVHNIFVIMTQEHLYVTTYICNTY